MGLPRIVLVPLDWRPPAAQFPKAIADIAEHYCVVVDEEILRMPPDEEKLFSIIAWLGKNLYAADWLVLSLDQLCYGGLFHSREPDQKLYGLSWRGLQYLRVLKKSRPDLRIHAFVIFPRATTEDGKTTRREVYWRNLIVIERAIDYVADSTLDALTVFKDDTPAGDERSELLNRLMQKAKDAGDRVAFLPGTDEAALLIQAKILNQAFRLRPLFYPIFSHPPGAHAIGLYENESVLGVLQRQITFIGAERTLEQARADGIICVYSKGGAQQDINLSTAVKPTEPEEAEKFARFARDVTGPFDQHFGRELSVERLRASGRQLVAVADVVHANGADPVFLSALVKRVPMIRVSAYAAWNTVANTTGTILAGLCAELVARQTTREVPTVWKRSRLAQLRFMFERILDDGYYQSLLRQDMRLRWPKLIVNGKVAPTPEVEEWVRGRMEAIAGEVYSRQFVGYMFDYPDYIRGFRIEHLSFPVQRDFEIDLRIRFSTSRVEELKKK